MDKFLKQYNIKWIGTFINILYTTAPLLGILMYIINAMTFYAVASVYILEILPWFSLPVFIVLLVVGVIVLLFVFYKFIYPSYYAFINRQSYIHNNPIRKDLAKIKAHLGIKDEDDEC